MVGPKKPRILAKNQHTQGIFFLNSSMNYGSSKSSRIVLSKLYIFQKSAAILLWTKIEATLILISLQLEW